MDNGVLTLIFGTASILSLGVNIFYALKLKKRDVAEAKSIALFTDQLNSFTSKVKNYISNYTEKDYEKKEIFQTLVGIHSQLASINHQSMSRLCEYFFEHKHKLKNKKFVYSGKNYEKWQQWCNNLTK